jgi:antitoxin component HigA of HigAB toxin-antitoxin module
MKTHRELKPAKDGRVFGKSGKELKQRPDKDGYMVVGNYQKVHRLVAQAFIPNPENKPTVNHINGDKSDNRVENLEWMTRSEQTQHAISTGLITYTYGEDHHTSKLTKKDIETIFYLKSLGWKQTDIANEMSVAQSRISEILNKKVWQR